jgi:putative ATPase
MSDQLFGSDDPGGGGAGPGAGAPLAVRMRPRELDDLVGQEHLLAEGSTLRTAIETGEPHSMVLYGPPGTGKTTLARIVASSAAAAFEELSAVQAGKAEVRAVIDRATERRKGGRPTIFFLDEIHRFNKAQQDALLPAVEEGLITLIGATTENPYFEVNSALISRAQIIELQALTDADVETLLRRAIERDELRGTTVDDDALAFLAARADGDARMALSALELAADTAGDHVTLAVAEDATIRASVVLPVPGGP